MVAQTLRASVLIISIFCGFILMWDVEAQSQIQDRTDVYFVAVGSQHHLDKRFYTNNVPADAPNYSAEFVSDMLMAHGARDGILVVSDEGHFVGREDIEKALIDIKHIIRKDNSEHPLIFFYYMGHGLGDQYNNLLYLPPGNLRFHGGFNQTYMVKLLKSAMSNYDIICSLVMFRNHFSMAHWDSVFASDLILDMSDPVDMMQTMELQMRLNDIDSVNRNEGNYLPGGNPAVPFVVLFDNCYGDIVQNLTGSDDAKGGYQEGMQQTVLSPMQDIILQEFAELQTEGLVLYAVKPGMEVRDYTDPSSEGYRIGALAWRLYFAFQEQDGQDSMTLAALRRAMEKTYPDKNDKGYANPSVPFELSPPRAEILQVGIPLQVSPSHSSNRFEKRLGTATSGVMCCEP